MDFRQITLLLLVSLFEYANSNCLECSGSGEYCCEYDTCCYSFYMTWWFWCIVIAVLLLQICGTGCYIRAKRQRPAMYYVQSPVSTTTHLQSSAGRVTSQEPLMQQEMHPLTHTQPPAYTDAQAPYNTQPPAYAAAQAGYTQPPS